MGEEVEDLMKLTEQGIAVIEGDAYLSADIIREGRLDVAREALLQFRSLIPEGGTVADIGACLGDYTKTFAEFVGRKGRVYAFEPNPPVFECLSHNLQFMHAGVVIAFGVGLGEAEAEVEIIVDHHNIGASRLTYPSSRSTGAITVSTLDHVARDWDRLDFIKIDAEGYEPLILNGGVETIQRFRPVMLMEINTWMLGKLEFSPEAVYQRLDALGYEFPRFDGPHGDILCLPK